MYLTTHLRVKVSTPFPPIQTYYHDYPRRVIMMTGFISLHLAWNVCLLKPRLLHQKSRSILSQGPSDMVAVHAGGSVVRIQMNTG